MRRVGQELRISLHEVMNPCVCSCILHWNCFRSSRFVEGVLEQDLLCHDFRTVALRLGDPVVRRVVAQAEGPRPLGPMEVG